MDYEVKKIDEDDFFVFADLYYKMTLCSPFGVASKSGATDMLLTSLKSPASIRNGLYSKGKLVGFANGHAISETTFFWSGLYIKKGHRHQAKKLIDATENAIETAGFKAIEANGFTSDGVNMMEKYNYEPKQILFRKEF